MTPNSLAPRLALAVYGLGTAATVAVLLFVSPGWALLTAGLWLVLERVVLPIALPAPLRSAYRRVWVDLAHDPHQAAWLLALLLGLFILGFGVFILFDQGVLP